MLGLLVILIGLAGLALGALGRSLLPGFAAAAIAGLVLVVAALRHAVRRWRNGEVIPWRVVVTLATGLTLVNLPLAFWFLLEVGLAHEPARFPWKALVSFVVVVVAPTSALSARGKTALALAVENGRDEVVPLLEGTRHHFDRAPRQ